MSEGQKPAPHIRERVGRRAAFLLGAGMTVFAVLTVAGVVGWSDNAGEPIHNLFVRILLGLIYSIWGLAIVGGAIFGFPAESHNRGRRTRHLSGDSGVDFD